MPVEVVVGLFDCVVVGVAVVVLAVIEEAPGTAVTTSLRRHYYYVYESYISMIVTSQRQPAHYLA